MSKAILSKNKLFAFSLGIASSILSSAALACGGFFCSTQPINQAQEQIVFRQDGQDITTMVQIQYQGEAADFAWVLPVPGIPEVSLGNNTIFPALERVTRPRFELESKGQVCDHELEDFSNRVFETAVPTSAGSSSSSSSGGVQILEEKEVGPFEMKIVGSEDPKAMAEWLVENNYDLSDRGEELIQPYVEGGMNFLALKLKNNASVGEIQPIIMKYQSEKPMIPIRLTAVAAQDNMGILVWLLGSARAVPENFLSVVPNYTQLNWWSGFTVPAYISYQNLITDAMDEAGGHGFATDYAGRNIDVAANLPESIPAQMFIEEAKEFSPRSFLNELTFANVLSVGQLVSMYKKVLTKDDGTDQALIALYQRGNFYDNYSAEELAAAKDSVIADIQETLIKGFEEGKALFDGDHYLTRMYTTLSAEEMTVDPVFAFNADMPDQVLTRRATLNMECKAERGLKSTTHWDLVLGEGTGRDGEKVLTGTGLPPTFTGNIPTFEQDAMWLSQQTSEVAAPSTVVKNDFDIVNFKTESNGRIEVSNEPFKSSSSGSLNWSWFILLFLIALPTLMLRPHRKANYVLKD